MSLREEEGTAIVTVWTESVVEVVRMLAEISMKWDTDCLYFRLRILEGETEWGLRKLIRLRDNVSILDNYWK